MRFHHFAHRPGSARWALHAVVAGAALMAGVAAHAQVNLSIGVEGPTYYEPPPQYQPPPGYYQPAPPAYYQPAPGYYRPPPPGYYRPAPGYEARPDWQRDRGNYEQPRLSDMQQRALNNCSLLAWRDQGRCRATVMSTVR